MEGDTLRGTAEPWVVSPGAAVGRLDGIQSFSLQPAIEASIALPVGYEKSRRQRYPMVVLLADDIFGSAVEMSRLVASTREIDKCIVVHARGVAADDSTAIAALVAECCRRYRVDAAQVAVFGLAATALDVLKAYTAGIPGVSRCILGTVRAEADVPASGPIAWTVASMPGTARTRDAVDWKVMPEISESCLAVPALLHGLRTFWGRKHKYGDEVVILASPWARPVARLAGAVLHRWARRPEFAPDTRSRHIVRAKAMGRDFEVFVSLPGSAGRDPARRYPAIVALDANGGFATVAEIAASLARSGEIDESIVVGIGTPRAQGELEFAFRRFEELSPPLPMQPAADDSLDRFFTALFALRGQDARVQLGQAPAFHDFIARELVPALVSQLPVDASALTLLGHSAGGTFVAYAFAQASSPFRNFACLSPGVAISGNWMLRHGAGAPVRADARIYLAIGSEELQNRFNRIAGIPRTPEYAELLRRRGARVDGCHVLDGDTHTTVYPRAVAQGLRALLRR